ncbi:hypothetical protein GCM10011320_03210 [Neoroseomonas lacus]|uniref:Uncharacterized protein n=1 Tax=Neoroseomonas lacus TaxID=287609 RepID=A0A917NGL7_9PROT|nr:hypothetical protein GCM10011320_03210 [Neoroseomonas lacus]
MPDPTTKTDGADATIVAVFPQRPEDRLRLALRRLDEAIGEQSMAAAGLRDAIGDLSRTMSRLGESVAGFRGALDNAAGEIEQALAASRRLQATADRMVV